MNVFNFRSLDASIFRVGLFGNPTLLAALGINVLLQVGAVYLPILQTALGTTGLTASDWGRIVAVSLPILAVGELLKLRVRRRLA